MKTSTNYQLSERFEVAFNQIHETLREIVKINDDRFKVLLDVGAKRHQMIKEYYDDLKQYAKLRNSIVHDKVEVGFYIAEPHETVVSHIEMIADIFKRPNFARSIATTNVVYFDYEDSMQEVFQVIKIHGYSQYPVYRNYDFIGLLATDDIVRWISENIINTLVDLSDIKVYDIISTVHDHPVEFVSKSTDIFTVEEIYEHKHKNKVDLEAVIITENGKRNEVPLGIITAWDLIQLDYQDESGND
ncbi:CBS domain-containing protein [Bacillus sp. BGMRC 2118]|nr:CBS domain-containing protein [Bacillus sp. BGMRC 2118]